MNAATFCIMAAYSLMVKKLTDLVFVLTCIFEKRLRFINILRDN